MTVPNLITELLYRIRLAFYDKRTREFWRDRTALMKAIARYGYECDTRSWQFSADDILADIVGLLQRVRESKADIKFLPIYLECAIDRHIRTRAEELSAKAHAIESVCSRLVARTADLSSSRKPSDVETLSILYRDLKRRRRQAKKTASQKELI